MRKARKSKSEQADQAWKPSGTGKPSQASATTCTKRKRKAPQAWLSGEAVEMAIAAANLAAAGEESSTCTAQGAEGGDVPAATTAASTKLTRFEAMWTDCDPELWEYVVV